ncbi:hypothetical protein JHD46_04670 [Sulfurimonas sp. SAG-AH-194-C20]|nr:hypothetical protein [Sulfurimonas sp. SAG-AH-194-C20]MDF1878929.1 hypothetical protein [Sulfurimonas sp. SAG-AH-194-C20]
MKNLIIFLFLVGLLGASEEFESIKKNYFISYDYEQMGKYSQAIKVLSSLYLKYPKGYTLNLRFGWLFFLDKKYKNAQKHYNIAILSNPYALDPRLGLTRVYLASASYAEAEHVAHELLKIDYYNYYANIYIVQALMGQKKFNIAQKVVSKMLGIYPTDINFLELLSVIYKETKSPYLKKVYEDILILNPHNTLLEKVKFI